MGDEQEIRRALSGGTDGKTHQRRRRYAGKYPRKFEEKYKELTPGKYPETVARVLASGKTPAGMHVPIMVPDVLDALKLVPGSIVVDCTLGYGGHARAMLDKVRPGGRLIALDADPVEIQRTEARMREEGQAADVAFCQSNFAGLEKVLAAHGVSGADAILADFGVSSMQLDSPLRGFSLKFEGPLDMRMNPGRGATAADLIRNASAAKLERMFAENADEPDAGRLASALAGRAFQTTLELVRAVREAVPGGDSDAGDQVVRRVFQAVRIAVNDEFSAIDMLLRQLPAVLNPGGRVAILTFHSGEDRRVKKAFQSGFRDGIYSAVARDVVRATSEERRANPRATSAKLRWAVRAE